MLPSTDKALLVSVTVLLVGGIVTASAVPAVATSHASTDDGATLQIVQEDDTEQEDDAGDANETDAEDDVGEANESDAEDGTETIFDDDTTQEDDSTQEADELSWDRRLTSNEVVWQSQQVYFNGAEVVNNASIKPIQQASESARTFQVRTVENGDLGTNVDEFTVNETGDAVIDMAGYEPGEYVIVYEEMAIAVDDGEGSFTSDVSAASFGVAIQNISAEFDPEQVTADESTSLEISSNRDESFLVRVTGTGLHQAQITSLMNEGDPFENSSVENGTILRISDSVEVQTADVPVDPGQYEFTVEVLGSGATDTASLTIGDPAGLNETGNESDGAGLPGDGTGTPDGDDEDMFTDEPGDDSEMPDDGTPTESQPAGEDESPTNDDNETGTTGETGPGFGLIAAAIGLLGAGLLARRRTD